MSVEGPRAGGDGSVVHIAGVDVTVGDRYRQRCSWCGAVLFDYDLTRLAVQTPEGWDDMTDEQKAAAVKPGAWPIGALVARNGAATYVVDHEDGQPVPPECCAHLDHDLTGCGL